MALLLLPAVVLGLSLASAGRSVTPPAKMTLAYVSDNGGIWLVGSDGTDLRRLRGTDDAMDAAPSPDAKYIAFTIPSFTDDRADIWLVGVDGKGLRRLTHDGESALPEWSPTGRRIFFFSNNYGYSMMNADGTGNHRLPKHHPPIGAWSPDGSRVALTSTDSRNRSQIYVMNSDGSNRRQLTANRQSPVAVSYSDPTWAPDGRSLAFARTIDERVDICRIGVDGRGRRCIARGGAAVPNDAPSWSPDGGLIAFARSTGVGEAEIFVIRPDGTGERQLTRGAQAFSPIWLPLTN